MVLLESHQDARWARLPPCKVRAFQEQKHVATRLQLQAPILDLSGLNEEASDRQSTPVFCCSLFEPAQPCPEEVIVSIMLLSEARLQSLALYQRLFFARCTLVVLQLSRIRSLSNLDGPPKTCRIHNEVSESRKRLKCLNSRRPRR